MLTQAILKKNLHYNPETGIFTWLVSNSHRVHVGDVAGHLHVTGYNHIRLFRKTFKAHRLAWFYTTGDEDKYEIDHINGIKDDNRLCNLRRATRIENCFNKGKNSNNTSGFKGVYWSKAKKKWQAAIGLNWKQNHLGYFSTPELAFEAYCSAARKHHGEFLHE